MKLYDAAGLAALGYNCITVLRRVVPPTGGRWIPYPHAEVLARRAAQMVACVVCVAVPVPSFTPAPEPPAPFAQGPALELVPVMMPRLGDTPAVSVPEPGSAAVLAVGLAALWRWRA